MTMYTYAAYGLNVESELELPQFRPAAFERADVQICWGTAKHKLTDVILEGVTFQRSKQELLLRLDAIANYYVSNGTSIIIERNGEVDDDSVRLFLLGSVFAALLDQRGILPLNGAAIQTPLGAVGFIGGNGTGKSTLAASLYLRGYSVVADEICAITLNEHEKLVILPSHPQTKLWSDSLRMLKLQSEKPVRALIDKYEFDVSTLFSPDPIPIHAIYYNKLDKLKDAEFPLKPIKGINKIARFRDCAYSPPHLPNNSALLMFLAQNVPLYELTYRNDWEQLDSLITNLEEAWRS